jgi:hypothetical protein
MLHPAGVGIRRIKSQYRNFFFGTVLLKEPRHKEITNGSVVQPVVRHGFYKINALGNLKKNTWLNYNLQRAKKTEFNRRRSNCCMD